MATKTYNPFPNLGKQYEDGMNYIIANLPTGDVTFENLNDTLIDYLETLFDSTAGPGPTVPPILDNVVYSILPNAANSYQNSNLNNESFYNEIQVMLISAIMDAVKNNSVEGIEAVLEDANEEIAKSGLSVVDQAPLFVAVEIGRRTYEYLNKQIVLATSEWRTRFFNDNPALNVANLPYWTAASIEAALSGYAQIQQLDMSVATSLNSVGRALGGTVAMLAAIGVCSGKIIYKWVQRPKLDLGKMTLFNDNLWNGGQIAAVSRSRRNRCCDIPDFSEVGKSCRGYPNCYPN